VEEIGLPELTHEQMEELCVLAEEAVKQYILSKIPGKRIETLNITVETEDEKTLSLTVEIELALSPLMQNFDAQKLTDGAIKEAFTSAEKYLRELKCLSQK